MSLFTQAKEAESELFAEYDKMDLEYRAWQSLFAKLHLPDGCAVTWQDPKQDGSPCWSVLEVLRNGEFAFGVWEEGDCEHFRSLLPNASAFQRVQGLAHMEQLWSRACSASKSYIEDVKSAIADSQEKRAAVAASIEQAV